MHLLSRVERYLRRSATTATAFGREVMRDPGFVRGLRKGREPRPETVERVGAWLDRAERALRRGS